MSEKQTLLLAVNLNMYTLILVSLCAQSYSINAKKLKMGTEIPTHWISICPLWIVSCVPRAYYPEVFAYLHWSPFNISSPRSLWVRELSFIPFYWSFHLTPSRRPPGWITVTHKKTSTRLVDKESLNYTNSLITSCTPSKESEQLYHWPLGRRPDDHPSLSDLGL